MRNNTQSQSHPLSKRPDRIEDANLNTGQNKDPRTNMDKQRRGTGLGTRGSRNPNPPLLAQGPLWILEMWSRRQSGRW